jgi:hypothetical protein
MPTTDFDNLDPDPPIPQQWHDLWEAIKAEGGTLHDKIHELGRQIAAKLDAARDAKAK